LIKNIAPDWGNSTQSAYTDRRMTKACQRATNFCFGDKLLFTFASMAYFY
jgi:hypothetical protein